MQSHQENSNLLQHVQKPQPGSPPASGCSELSTPECFSPKTQQPLPQQQEVTPVPEASPVPKDCMAADPLSPFSGHSNPAPSQDHHPSPQGAQGPEISPEDLAAAAAMLELPGLSISGGGSNSSSWVLSPRSMLGGSGGSSDFTEATDGPGCSESAAELLLAAGRLASVTSQSSRTGSFTRGPRNSGHSAAGTPPAAAAAVAAGMHPGMLLSAYAAGAVLTPRAAAAAAMYAAVERPPGCSCLKPCKSHAPCQHCGSPHSPGHTWRAGPAGPGTLCNACGTRYSRSRQKQMSAAAAAAGAAGWMSAGLSPAAGSQLLESVSSLGSNGSISLGSTSSGGDAKMNKPLQGRVSKAGSPRVTKANRSRSSKGAAQAAAGVFGSWQDWGVASAVYGNAAAGVGGWLEAFGMSGAGEVQQLGPAGCDVSAQLQQQWLAAAGMLQAAQPAQEAPLQQQQHQESQLPGQMHAGAWEQWWPFAHLQQQQQQQE